MISRDTRIKLVRISIRQVVGEGFHATSPDLPYLFIDEPNLSKMIERIPGVIKTLFRFECDKDVDVIWASDETLVVFPTHGKPVKFQLDKGGKILAVRSRISIIGALARKFLFSKTGLSANKPILVRSTTA